MELVSEIDMDALDNKNENHDQCFNQEENNINISKFCCGCLDVPDNKECDEKNVITSKRHLLWELKNQGKQKKEKSEKASIKQTLPDKTD